jgi:hypothetical protein
MYAIAIWNKRAQAKEKEFDPKNYENVFISHSVNYDFTHTHTHTHTQYNTTIHWF